MGRIEEALRLVELEIKKHTAVCVICNEGFPDESTLLGTRDGYLNMIRSLLILVAEFDKSRRDDCWDDRIKNNMLQLPRSDDTWLVGTGIVNDHAALLVKVKALCGNDPDVIQALEHDPAFNAPRE